MIEKTSELVYLIQRANELGLRGVRVIDLAVPMNAVCAIQDIGFIVRNSIKNLLLKGVKNEYMRRSAYLL